MKGSTVLRGALAAIFALAIAGVSTAWAQAPFDPPGLARAMAAKEFHVDRLLRTDGVVGVGVGLTAGGEAAVVILTEGPGVGGLPRRLDGVSVVIKVTGAFNAINRPVDGNHDHGDDTSTNNDPTSRFVRPVPLGVSTGNGTSCSAGTIGFRVTDGNDVYAMSNNHVYALSNTAADDSPIVQPGLYDSNCAFEEANEIGTLHSFVQIDFTSCSDGGVNYVDAAIALSSTSDLGNATPGGEYTPSSILVDANPNMKVKKYGRTTGLTKGTVTAIHLRVNIGYSAGTACFHNQILVEKRGKGGPFIKSGDSGSGLVTDNNSADPVGLLYAGTASGKTAIANRIQDVLDELFVDIDGP